MCKAKHKGHVTLSPQNDVEILRLNANFTFNRFSHSLKMKTFAPAVVVVVCLFKCPLQVTAMKAEHTVVDPQLLRGLIPGFYSSTAAFASSSRNTTPLIYPPHPLLHSRWPKNQKKLLQFSFLKNQQPQNEDPDGWLGGPVCCGRGRGETDSEPR